jgi:hypothetical protein
MVLKDYIENNSEILFKLQKYGVKNINVALDYLAIYSSYKSFSNVKSKMEQIELTATTCKKHVNSVREAIKYMEQKM